MRSIATNEAHNCGFPPPSPPTPIHCVDLRHDSVVEFQTAGDARAAIDNLQDTDLLGRLIFLREDREVSLVAPAASVGRSNFGGGGVSRGGNCKVCPALVAEALYMGRHLWTVEPASQCL